PQATAPREEKPTEAAKAFQEAIKKRTALSQAKLPGQAQWISCAQAFRQVYQIDRDYRFAGDAAYEEGLLYQQVGDIFGGNNHYQTAISRFQLLVTNYYNNSHCPDALKRIRDMHLLLKNEKSAKEADRILHELYPEEAALLNAIKPSGKIAAPPPLPDQTAKNSKTTAAQQSTAPAAPAPPQAKPAVATPVRTESKAEPKAKEAQTSQKAKTAPGKVIPKSPVLVKNISHKADKGSVRAVIGLDRSSTHTHNRLGNPDRIFIDIENAVLAEQYKNKAIAVNDKHLHQIRTSQSAAGVVRIVFDISSVGEYSVTALSNPHRIEVEFRHADAKPSAAPEPKPVSREPKLDAAGKKPTKAAAAPQPTGRTGNGTHTLTRMLGLKINRIVLDPGHGGTELGAVGPGGMYEKDLVLAIALDLKTKLEAELEVEVILTRDSDIAVPLEKRTEIANNSRADLFISIHANASPSKSLSGVETYYLDFAKTKEEQEIAAQENLSATYTVSELEDLVKRIAVNDKTAESRELASIVQKNLFSDVRQLIPASKDRGVRSAPFVVLVGANMPSVLAEVSFISNPNDEKLLSKKSTQKAFAQALYSGIADYMDTLGSKVVRNQTR
ncbi:MAG: N-acetylmuramoyl-L-alanine amidase, partial [Acidobacteriota bacterium]|nr:N-acetylmuramoyl-L-alanine amidase [Acidobacteriota bacterium]